MKRTGPLGSTGWQVSRLGLGLAALGRPGYINLGHAHDLQGHPTPTALQAHAATVLEEAWSAGVRYFDAARSYGQAEAFLAAWLAARTTPTDGMVIGSKWGYTYTANWQITASQHEVKDHSLTTLVRQVQESRTLLGSRLQLYQIHSATLESGVLDNQPVLEELARLKADGLKIGISVSGPRQIDTLRRALAVTVAGERLFDCVQATWNILERSAEPALIEAHQAGVGVIVKEALANGRLTSRNQAPSFARQRTELEKLATRSGVTVDAVALATVLQQPWCSVVLSGAATVEHLRANLAAWQVPESPALAEELAEWCEPPEAYWATRSQLPWN